MPNKLFDYLILAATWPSLARYSESFKALMSKVLPAKNEEYGSKEYWSVALSIVLSTTNLGSFSDWYSPGRDQRYSECIIHPTYGATVSLSNGNSREANGETFDWFKSYADLAEILNGLIPEKSSRILMLGCGNSRLSEDVSFQKGLRKVCLFKEIYLKLWADGYRNVVNTDVHLKFLLVILPV